MQVVKDEPFKYISSLLKDAVEYLCFTSLVGDEVAQTHDAHTASGLCYGSVQGSLFTDLTALNFVVS